MHQADSRRLVQKKSRRALFSRTLTAPFPCCLNAGLKVRKHLVIAYILLPLAMALSWYAGRSAAPKEIVGAKAGELAATNTGDSVKQPENASGSQQPDQPNSHPSSEVPEPQAVAAATLPLLPPRSAPFSAQLPILISRAEAGDPVATCRVLLDSMRCAHWSEGNQFERILEESVSTKPPSDLDDRAIDVLARDHHSSQQTEVCAGFDRQELRRVEQLSPSVFTRLTPRQKVLVAMTRHDGTLVRLPRGPKSTPRGFSFGDEYMVPQVLADRDLQFIADGLAAHDPLALEAAMLLHTPKAIPGLPFLLRQAQPNPYKFALYAAISNDLFGPDYTGAFANQTLAQIQSGMTSEERVRFAQELAHQLQLWRARNSAMTHDTDDLSNTEPAAACERLD